MLLPFVTKSEDPDWTPPIPGGSAGGGWFKKVGALIVAWKLRDTHRMRRLLQRWETIPLMRTFTVSLMDHVQQYGLPKNMEGEFTLS